MAQFLRNFELRNMSMFGYSLNGTPRIQRTTTNSMQLFSTVYTVLEHAEGF